MGIWDVFNSTNDFVKQNTPDLTPIKNACQITYDLGCTAASKIDKTVRVDATQRLKEKLPDSEGQEKIGRILKNIGIHAVDYTVKETFKSVTGGIHFYNIIREGLKDEPTSRSLPHEIKKSEQLGKEMREMQAKMQKMDEEMKMLVESVKGKELPPPNAGRSDSTVLQKPEVVEIISIFP